MLCDSERNCSLIVADYYLPKRSGLELCRFVRSQTRLSCVPFLIVAGGDNPDLAIECLNAGADDFLKRPFSPREFESRIGALLRRVKRDEQKFFGFPFDRAEKGALVVDTQSFEVRLDGTVVRMSHKEFLLCVALVSRFDRMVPYEDLLRSAWGEYYEVGRENLKVHMHSLKKKLAGGPTIEVIRGFGYRMKDSS
jgi:DNA-binding response OmpR family regulator